MTTIDRAGTAVPNAKLPHRRAAGRPAALRCSPQVEPMAGLAWSRAVELPDGRGRASKPSEIRRAWAHRAPEAEVLALYRATQAADPEITGPWWITALLTGALPSRAAAFAIEDEVAEILLARAGWAFMPWASRGEDGYWEYLPSELHSGGMLIPTTVTHNAGANGLLEVVGAHNLLRPAPMAITGAGALIEALPAIERL
ncbi:MAG: hypothetical protein ACRDRL_01260 [Sciscionella sp.]